MNVGPVRGLVAAAPHIAHTQQTEGAAMYELTDVSKNFTRGATTIQALDGVDLSIRDGEFLAIQGPTGQGKSTLLLLLGGLDRASAGSVVFDQQNLGELRESELARLRATAFGFVFQTFNLIPTLTAQENVETALVGLGVAADERHSRARAMLEELGLADRSSHLPSELSGGQQQRVAIARALVKHPTVLLADEPTGNLDEGTRDDIIGLLETLWRERGLTLIIVTHDTAVARRAQRVVVIENGRLEEQIPTDASVDLAAVI
jgi:putative ABC transport system ATP-binding protein